MEDAELNPAPARAIPDRDSSGQFAADNLVSRRGGTAKGSKKAEWRLMLEASLRRIISDEKMDAMVSAMVLAVIRDGDTAAFRELLNRMVGTVEQTVNQTIEHKAVAVPPEVIEALRAVATYHHQRKLAAAGEQN